MTRVEYRSVLAGDKLLMTGFSSETSEAAEKEMQPGVHSHDGIQIVLCHKGECSLEINGARVSMENGDLLVIMPLSPHVFLTVEAESCDILYVDSEMCMSGLGVSSAVNFAPIRTSYVLIRSTEDPEAYQTARQMAEEMKSGGEHHTLLLSALMLALLIRIQRRLPENVETVSKIPPEIKPALAYIHKCYMNRIPMDVLSELCHMSVTNFRRKFTEATKYTPLVYINTIRIQKSCVLLASTDQSILEISHAVGFDSLSSFNRQFLSIMGEPPLKWRKEHR